MDLELESNDELEDTDASEDDRPGFGHGKGRHGDDDWCPCGSAFTTYRTQKIVKIRSKLLQIPHLMIKAVLLLVFVYQQLYLLGIMTLEDLSGDASVSLTQSQGNWASCHDAFLDCDDRDSQIRTPPSTCNQAELAELDVRATKYFLSAQASNRTRGVSGFPFSCRFLDVTEAAKPLGPSSVLLVTSKQKVVQTRCQTSSCTWQNDEVTTEFTDNVEQFKIKVSHGWLSRATGKGRVAVLSESSAGFLLDKDNHAEFIDCADGYETAACLMARKVYRNRGLGRCGSLDARTSDCFQTKYSDIIDIGKLLTMAGLDLDNRTWGGLPYLFWGHSLHVNTHMFTGDAIEFWKDWFLLGYLPSIREGAWIIGLPRYTYSVLTNEIDFPVTEVKDEQQNSRTLVVYRGLKIKFNTFGEVRTFDPLFALIKLVTGLVILSYGTDLVDKVLIKLYRLAPCKSLKHVYYMHQAYRAEEHPDQEKTSMILEAKGAYTEINEKRAEAVARRHKDLLVRIESETE